MDHIDMKRIEKIPIKAISYDLKLALFDEMEAEDVAELTKVDRQFRSILLQEPSRVFGKHIYEIRIYPFAVFHPAIHVRKLESSLLRGVADPNNFFRNPLPPALFERVRSAQLFTVVFNDPHFSHLRDSNTIAIIKTGSLSNLKCVNELRCDVTEVYFLSFEDDYVQHLPTVMERARLNFYSNRSIAEMLSTVIETRLGNCKEISLSCTDDQYEEIHGGLARAKFEMIVFDAIQRYTGSSSMLPEIIRHIVTKGIPSTYEKAAILVKCRNSNINKEFFSTLFSTLFAQHSTFTELQPIEEEDRKEIRRIRGHVSESLNNYAIAKNVKMLSKNNLYYTEVDGVRKTIYVIDTRRHLFFAKSVPLHEFL